MIKFVTFFFAIFCASSVMAHSGGTDHNGCHYDHQSGGYHCHGHPH